MGTCSWSLCLQSFEKLLTKAYPQLHKQGAFPAFATLKLNKVLLWSSLLLLAALNQDSFNLALAGGKCSSLCSFTGGIFKARLKFSSGCFWAYLIHQCNSSNVTFNVCLWIMLISHTFWTVNSFCIAPSQIISLNFKQNFNCKPTTWFSFAVAFVSISKMCKLVSWCRKSSLGKQLVNFHAFLGFLYYAAVWFFRMDGNSKNIWIIKQPKKSS